MTSITIQQGDITKLQVDAIVNAANSSLLGGGGVDGAIHRAAGPELLHECRLLGSCKTGEAKMTGGYHLPAKHIIHTVGPVWNGGNKGEATLLAACYANSLCLAAENGLRSIAFPNISTGIYHFPKPLAAGIAIKAVRDFIAHQPDAIAQVVFVCHDAENFALYRDGLSGRDE